MFTTAPGKSAPPISFIVLYPRQHPLGRMLPVTVRTANGSQNSDSLEIDIRPEDGLKWYSGEQKKIIKKRIPKNRESVFSFAVVPLRAGQTDILVELRYLNKKANSGAVFHIPVIAGGALSDKNVNGTLQIFRGKKAVMR